MMTLALKRAWGVAALLLLTGCASYRAVPLPSGAKLAPSIEALDRTIPGLQSNDRVVTLPASGAFTIDQVGLLAILNDPELAAQRGRRDLAKATLLTALLLPNPSVGLGSAALLAGPGSTPAYMASIAEDIRALVTYRARVAVARAEFGSVNASLLWQQWQIAQQARLLAAQIYGYDHEIFYRQHALRLLRNELQKVRSAAARGALDLMAEAPLLSATASAEVSLASRRLVRLKAWQHLDALIGLEPWVRFTIQPPELAPMPRNLKPLIASLPERRPDLVALRLGYQAQEESVRAAILGQFPPFSFGGRWTADTGGVRSVGPTVTMDLPIFNRNQGNIASTRATRQVLYAQYQAALDRAAGTARAIEKRLAVLRNDLQRAKLAAAATERLSRKAERAYAQRNLSERALTDYQTAALERKLEVVSFRTQFDADRLALGIELGIGLPAARLEGRDAMKPA
jgi:outer membrane protein TolC